MVSHFQRIISFPNKINTVQSIINMIHNLRELRDLCMFYCALHDPRLGLFRMDFLLLGVAGDLTLSNESSVGKKIMNNT